MDSKWNWRNKLGAVCLGGFICVSGLTTSAQADDTEVYFGQYDSSLNIFPNVLFVLDTSSSMNQSDESEGEYSSRISRLKTAMDSILDAATNVNVGLMRFSGKQGGGPILYPATYIDETVCERTDCGIIDLVSRISETGNDAKQYENGAVILDSPNIQMTQNTGENSIAAFRFPDLDIPSGATITSAELEFTSYDTATYTNNLIIQAEAAGDSEVFTTADNSISSRTKTQIIEEWSPSDWFTGNIYQSPDVKDIIQEVIDHEDWCGGNALSVLIKGIGSGGSIRNAIAHDYSPNDAVLLKVSYDSTSIDPDKGCLKLNKVFQVSSDNDDAEQFLSNNRLYRDSSDLELADDRGTEQLVGIRFSEVALPKDIEITDAYLEFQIDEYETDDVTLNIWGESEDSPPEFSSAKSDISDRTKTTAMVPWVNPTAAYVGEKLQSENITSIVQEIVGRDGWQSDNSMAFMIGHGSGSGKRTVESYRGKPAESTRLYVEYKSYIGASSLSYITARDKMKALVSNLTVAAGTPIVEALYEAALYYRGSGVDYGLERGLRTSRYHRVSSPLSYTGGTVVRSSLCTDADLDAEVCESEYIQNSGGSGVATYLSPMESSCQTNHLVLLSDGAPSSNSASTKIMSLIESTTTEEVPDCVDTDFKKCGIELINWLNTTDHSELTGTQNISTYTIGLNHNSSFLDDLAEAGGSGQSEQASSAGDLINVFNNILGEVLSVDTSFVAPSSTVNQFNRLSHRSDIYFSLFKPEEGPTWEGNLKKYNLDIASDGNVRIFDNSNPPKEAVDEESGYFAEGTKSYWSEITDGNSVALGGAVDALSLGTEEKPRKVYTYSGSSPTNVSLNSPEHYLHEDNKNSVTRELLGISGQNDAYHENLLKWARGVDILDTDNDGETDDIRKHMGDPMHSQPLLLNYATDSTTEDSTIFVSTNEGFLHAIEHVEGEEIFSFIPQELLPNLDIFYRNSSIDPHPYGLDGSLSSWIDDANDNTVVDAGESAHIYMGMRRGGRNYYAMDVSNRDNPELSWVINGGESGFEQLGQSWSRMIPTKMMIDGSAKQVLVFAGGYDKNQDPADDGSISSRSTDNVGRAVFIVDAETGAKIWTGSGINSNSGPGEFTYFPDMKYSIPTDLRVVDIDYDGVVDQMYFGDMGGQVWRLDVNQLDSSESLVDGGVLAEFASDNDPTEARRFFYPPDLALLSESGERYLAISIGSGWRSHPLDYLVEDEFYMIRTDSVYSAPDGYGKVDDSSIIPHTYSKITSSDLVDITDDVDTEIDWTDKVGWKLKMEETGEKILSSSITANNQIVFTSYVPQLATEACATALGGGRVYLLGLRDGKPKLNLDGSGDDSNLTESDRYKDLVHGGIPPSPAVLFTENAEPIILVGPEQPLDDINLSVSAVRTYWREQEPPTTASTD